MPFFLSKNCSHAKEKLLGWRQGQCGEESQVFFCDIQSSPVKSSVATHCESYGITVWLVTPYLEAGTFLKATNAIEWQIWHIVEVGLDFFPGQTLATLDCSRQILQGLAGKLNLQ